MQTGFFILQAMVFNLVATAFTTVHITRLVLPVIPGEFGVNNATVSHLWQTSLPKGELIGFVQEIIDMIRIWKVFGCVISVEAEQLYGAVPPCYCGSGFGFTDRDVRGRCTAGHWRPSSVLRTGCPIPG